MKVLIKGAGDLASGIACRLYHCGMDVVMTEIGIPTTVRRTVAFSPAIYEGKAEVEGIEGVRCDSMEEMVIAVAERKIPVLEDPECQLAMEWRPDVVVDAIIAKKNLGTTKEMAPLVIALGPGFTAGEDVDVVIETKRGHNLGRVIRSGSAVPNTGIPGIIGGYGKERVMHAQAEGILRNVASIGDIVEARAVIAEIETENRTVPVEASLSGLLRGLIRDGYPVTKGFKIADIDPRKEELQNCFTISDKARCIAGSVLEVICGELE